jgi:hypothetical protein
VRTKITTKLFQFETSRCRNFLFFFDKIQADGRTFWDLQNVIGWISFDTAADFQVRMWKIQKLWFDIGCCLKFWNTIMLMFQKVGHIQCLAIRLGMTWNLDTSCQTLWNDFFNALKVGLRKRSPMTVNFWSSSMMRMGRSRREVPFNKNSWIYLLIKNGKWFFRPCHHSIMFFQREMDELGIFLRETISFLTFSVLDNMRIIFRPIVSSLPLPNSKDTESNLLCQQWNVEGVYPHTTRVLQKVRTTIIER